MDLNTFYDNKKSRIIYISIYEIIVNALVFALFVYGMHIQKIRPAFGIFVAWPALIMTFVPCNFHHLKDINYVKEHKYFLQQVCVRFGLACFNLITCINARTALVYWIHDSFIRNSFLIYIVSAALMIPITLYLNYNEKNVLNEIYEKKNQNTMEQTNNNDVNIIVNTVELVDTNIENKENNEVPDFVISVVDCGAANPLDNV